MHGTVMAQEVCIKFLLLRVEPAKGFRHGPVMRVVGSLRKGSWDR